MRTHAIDCDMDEDCTCGVAEEEDAAREPRDPCPTSRDEAAEQEAMRRAHAIAKVGLAKEDLGQLVAAGCAQGRAAAIAEAGALLLKLAREASEACAKHDSTNPDADTEAGRLDGVWRGLMQATNAIVAMK